MGCDGKVWKANCCSKWFHYNKNSHSYKLGNNLMHSKLALHKVWTTIWTHQEPTRLLMQMAQSSLRLYGWLGASSTFGSTSVLMWSCKVVKYLCFKVDDAVKVVALSIVFLLIGGTTAQGWYKSFLSSQSFEYWADLNHLFSQMDLYFMQGPGDQQCLQRNLMLVTVQCKLVGYTAPYFQVLLSEFPLLAALQLLQTGQLTMW